MAEMNSYRLADGCELRCEKTVRLLPGKRRVCVGTLDEERAVFAKLYLDPKRGRVHWQRELDGIRAFQQAGILTAELLYAGELSEHGWPVIVSARIPEPVSIKQAWVEADDNGREQLLRRMVSLLARHHNAGLLQTDMHLDNFVLSDDEIYSLDGAGVMKIGAALGPDGSLENLSLLLAQLNPEWDTRAPQLYAAYLNERGWRKGPGAEDLKRRVRRKRKGRWREYQGKLFRECSDFVCRKQPGRVEMVVRGVMSPALESLLADPDATFPGKELALKNGNTCTVWTADVDGRPVVIKRYNVKNLWHGAKLATRRGRAFVSWESAHRLRFFGIATPRPIALLKERRGVLQPVAYFIMEQVGGIGAHDWFRDSGVPREQKERMAEKIARLFDQLKEQRISHGDMKASNILLVENEPMLIDLDAMCQHAWGFQFRKAWKRDMRRFMRNWEDMPELKEMFSQVLQGQLD